MSDPLSIAGLALGAISVVYQSYAAVIAAYDVYLDFQEFSSIYRDIRMCLLIERSRLELWASLMQLEKAQAYQNNSTGDLTFWKLFELILNSILNALQESHEKMEHIGRKSGLSTQGDHLAHELMGNLSLSALQKPKLDKTGALRKLKFILRDQSRMHSLVKHLCYLNDSLEKMTSQLERESLRRQLRTNFATREISEMAEVRNAAALLDHKDIQHLASAKMLVEQVPEPGIVHDALGNPDPMFGNSLLLDLDELEIPGAQYVTSQPRAMALYKSEEVIIDWRTSEDDAWRTKFPEEFRKRTENLTMVLNWDLKPLDLAILHCVGYLHQSKNVTGYAFRLPDYARSTRSHSTLFDLVSQERDPRDLPDLGERFELAKALVRTVSEIQNINWLHKNISCKNVIFWPKDQLRTDPDITRPYLMGFDISRPNQDFEESERPSQRADDEHYRHPDYREPLNMEPAEVGRRWRTFRPSYDIYSLGVVLYEIGIWHNLSHNPKKHSNKPSMQRLNSDPQLVQKLLGQKQIRELKRHTGLRYTNVVTSCLDHELDSFWEDLPTHANHPKQLQRYLRHLQNRIVDPLALCCA